MAYIKTIFRTFGQAPQLLVYGTSLFVLVAACSPKSSSRQTSEEAEINLKVEFEIDTILEPNDPNTLDSTKHQLFLDTTRNSKCYNRITNWKPNEFDVEGANYYYREAAKNKEISKVDLKDFPRRWLSIHSLNGNYVGYQPINGIDWRFTLTDSSVNHYRMEADADAIQEVITLSKNELILKLATIPQKRENQVVFLRIKKTKIPYLYTFQWSETERFAKSEYVALVTPVKHLPKFDLVVSTAPRLVVSSVKFDDVKRKDVELGKRDSLNQFLEMPFDLHAFKTKKKYSNSSAMGKQPYHWVPSKKGIYYSYMIFGIGRGYLGANKQKLFQHDGLRIVVFKELGERQHIYDDPTEELLEVQASFNDLDLPELAFVGLPTTSISKRFGKEDFQHQNCWVYQYENKVLILNVDQGVVKWLKYVVLKHQVNPRDFDALFEW